LKVNISYAVEIEDVPIEVGKLITNAGHRLAVLLDEVENVGTSNPTRAVESIARIREGLADLDLRLSDCSNILSGYVGLQNREPAQTLNLEEEDDS
tara:strand:- start:1923 stop:2210 length:288 start_codon:yes stop_codon:yes gene_type:complete